MGKAREVLDRFDEMESNTDVDERFGEFVGSVTNKFRQRLFPAMDVQAALNAALTASRVTGSQKAAAITAAARFPGAGVAGRAMMFPGAGGAATAGAAVEGGMVASMLSAALAKAGVVGSSQVAAFTAAAGALGVSPALLGVGAAVAAGGAAYGAYRLGKKIRMRMKARRDSEM